MIEDYYMLIHCIEGSGREKEKVVGFSLDTDKLKAYVAAFMKKTGWDTEGVFWHDEGSKETLYYGAVYVGIHIFTIKRVPKEMIL